MTSKITIFFIAGIVAIGMFFGFSNNDPIQKDLSQRSSGINNPEIVYGPALDDPLSVLNESFEGTTFPPAGWLKLSPDGGTGWNRQTSGTTPIPGFVGGVITTPPGGGNACAFESWNTGGASANDQWLITPQLTNMQSADSLKFWLRYWPNSYRDSIEVRISTTTPTAAAMTTLVWRKSFLLNSPDTNWTQYGFRIGSLVPAGSNIYIGFREVVPDNLNDGATFSLDLVSVTAGVSPPTCNYSWSAQTSGTTQTLYSVSAVSDQVGWAAGAAATVIRTTNGGTTWTSASGTGISGDVYNIYALSATDALCTTSPAATFIYKTTNGGTTWTQVYTLAGGFINAIHMVSATEGYAEGDPVGGKWTIVKTTDGGNTWARMATEPAQVGTEAGWNNALYIIGTNIWFGTNATKVYHSTDMGVTWTSGATTGTVNSYGVHFNNPTTGLAGGPAMVVTTHGGTSYSAATAPGTTGNLNGIEGAGTDWWALRSDANIYRSTNGAANWTTAYTQAGAVFQDIDFVDVGGCPKGWAVGNAGAVARMQTITGISNYNNEIPASFNLKQNYPNPFNPTTNINFSLPKSGLVTLKVYDMVGKEVATLVNEVKSAGNYIVGFNASNLPSGAYFYRIESGNFTDTKKMLLIK
ncbi:MAG: choice-of-anchor J domain-containing protein [Ignavibacteria bacterium]|nr:choice-of-anchor J domain-containing protein [Ignavibacteria bacterium]